MRFRKKQARVAFYFKILKRDRGICAICDKNNENLLTYLKSIGAGDRDRLAKEHKIPKVRLYDSFKSQYGRLWDMDHIIPLSEAGPDIPANIRTLCLACHLNISKISFCKLHGVDYPEELEEWIKKYSDRI